MFSNRASFAVSTRASEKHGILTFQTSWNANAAKRVLQCPLASHWCFKLCGLHSASPVANLVDVLLVKQQKPELVVYIGAVKRRIKTPHS